MIRNTNKTIHHHHHPKKKENTFHRKPRETMARDLFKPMNIGEKIISQISNNKFSKYKNHCYDRSEIIEQEHG